LHPKKNLVKFMVRVDLSEQCCVKLEKIGFQDRFVALRHNSQLEANFLKSTSHKLDENVNQMEFCSCAGWSVTALLGQPK
jgi:hypothetical protein